MLRTFTYLSASAFVLSMIAGCSSGSEEAEPAAETDEAAVVSCGAAKYNEALAHYKNAVAYAKDRLEHGVCESDNGYQWEIADEASRAVMTCGAFHETIKSSPWAAPIRDVLADSLTLSSLTGELLVIKDSQFQNWNGVEKQLAKGMQFWAQSNGAVGSRSQLVLRANGKGTFQYVDTDSQDWTQKKEAASWSIDAPADPKAKRHITVKHGGLTEVFTLSVEAGSAYDDAPIFTLTPAHEGNKVNSATKMYSLVGECEA